MSDLLAHKLQVFIDESARESGLRFVPTADFHRAFVRDHGDYSAQAIRQAMESLGFDRTWTRMFRLGKYRVVSIYEGLELTCEVPEPQPRRIFANSVIESDSSAESTPQPCVIRPTIEFYEAEILPTIVEKWRRQFADTLMSTCRDNLYRRDE